ncbi:low molecular weight phosphatase family protein [Kineosporia sp. A_224]|uniref:arsenate reductase/protein-tyrosine-phosphatase family protein n=1 Tax=Kineosporia sp. A_224 TaxID=1962180 RepID=UPI0013045C35|nr:low molecular weight phosphatase family protein [Kineosporia sp. A_224]
MAGVLFVCAVNRARSPWAELACRALLAQVPGGADVAVASAGTWTRGGEPMWGPAAQEAWSRGLDPEGFTSRMLTPAIAGEASVVLAATRALRDEVICSVPTVLARTFTWRELAWLVTAQPPVWAGESLPERLRLLPEHARRARGAVAAPPPAALDVDDPAGRSAATVRRCADETFTAVTTIVGALSR